MIKLIQQGSYKLIETRKQTKVLMLDSRKTFAWINAKGIGEILVTSHKRHQTDALLATGSYRIYEVTDEPYLTDLIHMELMVGVGRWQGYLLTSGLPTDAKKRGRVIPTEEIITNTN